MLNNSSIKQLKGKRNLLAFSAGGDSTTLFFLLRENNIDFDIAIVDYGVRDQSKDEVHYAKNLANQYNKICHTYQAPIIDKNFESKAREIRYNFFDTLITQNSYDNLLTAHHLGDRFEWMLMQFCKGSGCIELAGMQEIQQRDNYKLIRPLLHLDKTELLNYLNSHNIKYFEDETNLDESIKRNSFRHKYSAPLLNQYLNGIKKSFHYIDEDKKILSQEIKITSIDTFSYFKSSQNTRADIFTIDKHLKQCQYMPSAKERELLKMEKTVVLGRKFIVNQEHNYVFILPYQNNKAILSKKFKEDCRVLRIEPKLRAYLSQNPNIFLTVKKLLTSI